MSPDGRLKMADDQIYTPGAAANDTGPGTLVWDPRLHAPGLVWPATNLSRLKSALLGGSLRVVAVTAWDPPSGAGFEQVAFAPAADAAGDAYVRVQAVAGNVTLPGPAAYFTVSYAGDVAPGDARRFYLTLFQEQVRVVSGEAEGGREGGRESLPGAPPGAGARRRLIA